MALPLYGGIERENLLLSGDNDISIEKQGKYSSCVALGVEPIMYSVFAYFRR